jgi:uroporphyrinogen decarboxylase
MQISEEDLARFQQYVRPVPTPPGFTSREIVRRAIEFADPPRIPYSFIEPLESDFVELGAVVATTGRLNMYAIPKGEIAFDEWGVGWRSSGRLWGHAEVCPLADLSALQSYQFPQVITEEQIALVKLMIDAGTESGKYVMGADPIGMYERLRSVMGFENLMIAMYDDRSRFEVLLDKMTDMTTDVVRMYEGLGGVHGFMSWDDWGLQTNLQINPAYWRKLFKPRYARIVEACHKAKMHYVLHSCGFISAIIPDLVEIGVDVLQIDQPRLMGVEQLADAFGGTICFWNCVDIQWSTSHDVTLGEVLCEPARMIEHFGRYHGGFIARQYPQPRDIEISPDMHRAIYEAFMSAGCR